MGGEFLVFYIHFISKLILETDAQIKSVQNENPQIFILPLFKGGEFFIFLKLSHSVHPNVISLGGPLGISPNVI
jgi:hypothetical protein